MEIGKSAPLKRCLQTTLALGLVCALFACTHPRATQNPAQSSETRQEVAIPLVQNAGAYIAQLSAQRVPDGSLVVLTVDFKNPFHGKVSASFEGKTFGLYRVSRLESGVSRYEGLFGVPHSHKPGPVSLKISAAGLPESTVGFNVIEANYISEVLKVAESKVKPNKHDLARIMREVPIINKAVRTETPKRYWTGRFELPVDGRVTDPFGTKRVYNGELKSYHGGVDFHAPLGTPIFSAGAGRIVLAGNYFYTGNTVMIDHGLGMVTMYFHMSKIKVRKGQMVHEHQLLGLSGATGRVTGPHLHWQCDVHGVKINPMDLVEGSAASELTEAQGTELTGAPAAETR